MRVQALSMGFYEGQRIRPGQQFSVPEGTKGGWFVPVEAVKAPPPAPIGRAARGKGPQALSQMGKEASQSFTEVHSGKGDLA